MVYDKDYYDFIEELLNKIEKLKNERIELNIDTSELDSLKNSLEVLENSLSEIEDKAISAFEVISGRKFNHDEINNITKLAKSYEDVNKSIDAIFDKLNNPNLSNKEINEYQTKLNALEELKNNLSQDLGKFGFIDEKDIENASQYRDEIETVGEQLNDIRKETIKLGKEQDKILEQTKEWKKNVKGIKEGYEQFTSNIKKSFNIIKDATEFWRKQDEQITKMVATFGLTTEEFKQYRDASYKAGVDLAYQYGKTQEDMVKLQQGYAEATGKNIILTKDNYEAQFQLQQLMGEENALALTSGIEQFGVGIDDARDKLYDIYKTNTKTGVSWAKTSKDLVKNLSLAQKYNFKGGLDNMMQMTVWANKMKINLQTIGSIADRISNPEGAIETAAKLQVLGGAFASMSNPLQMLYESLDDIGGLGERIESMFDGLGRFDRNLGEVRIAGPDRMRIKAAAEAMGMSYEEAMNIVNNKAKRSAVEQDVSFNPEITKDNRDFLATLGQWNNIKKQFEVRTYDEKKRDYVTKNINELSNEEIEKLRQEPDDDIKKLVERTFSIDDNIKQMALGVNSQKAAYQDGFREFTMNSVKSAKDVLGKMDELGQILTNIQLLIAGFMAVKAGIGGWKMGKGALKNIKAVRSGNVPNTFGGRATNAAFGKWGNLSKGMKAARVGGASAGILSAASYGIGNGIETYNSVEEAENARLLDIKNGILQKGSEEDKRRLQEIKKLRNHGIGKTVGSTVGAGLGAWGGAAAGAAIGSAFGGVGAIPGAIIGLLMGGLGGMAGGEALGSVGGAIGDAVSVDDGIANKKTVIKANKDDTALFAKDNGPFDKLFGNIIPKIDNIDNVLNTSNELNYNNDKVYGNRVYNSTSGSKMRNSSIYNNSLEKGSNIIVPKPIGDSVSTIKEISSKNSSKEQSHKTQDINIKPLEINLNGALKLDMGSAGQVDIMKELKSNPTFMRELSRMLVEQMSSSLYGGKAKLDQNRFARFQS